MCNFLKSMFVKKQPKEWTFGPKPVVNWKATNKSKYDMETICKLILTKILGIEDVELYVYTNDKQVSMFDNANIEIRAILTMQPMPHTYTLFLKSNVIYSELLSIICHEMVHLKQYEQKKLFLKDKKFFWNNQEYSPEIPYWNRPWEIEARKEQYKIEKEVKKLYFK